MTVEEPNPRRRSESEDGPRESARSTGASAPAPSFSRFFAALFGFAAAGLVLLFGGFGLFGLVHATFFSYRKERPGDFWMAAVFLAIAGVCSYVAVRWLRKAFPRRESRI